MCHPNLAVSGVGLYSQAGWFWGPPGAGNCGQSRGSCRGVENSSGHPAGAYDVSAPFPPCPSGPVAEGQPLRLKRPAALQQWLTPGWHPSSPPRPSPCKSRHTHRPPSTSSGFPPLTSTVTQGRKHSGLPSQLGCRGYGLAPRRPEMVELETEPGCLAGVVLPAPCHPSTQRWGHLPPA